MRAQVQRSYSIDLPAMDGQDLRPFRDRLISFVTQYLPSQSRNKVPTRVGL